MTSNYKKWKDFLYPLKDKGPSPPQNNYDTTTIEPIACMSCDLANMLEQAVGGGREEYKVFPKRNLFPKEDSRESPTKFKRGHMQQDNRVLKGKEDCGNDDSSIKESINSLNTDARPISEIIDLTTDSVDDEEGSSLFQKKREYSGSPLPFNNVPSPGTQNPALLPRSSFPLQADDTGKVTSTAQKDKRRQGQTSPVNPRSTSLSKWNLSMFADYINFDDYVHELRLCGQTTGVEDLDLKVLFDDILGMFGSNSLKDCMVRENESRVLLDGILMKLCKQNKLCVQMEMPCTLQYLPNGKLDYLITTRDGVPLGCVEAKSRAGMEMKSFCQAVLELNLLQQIALKKGVDVVNTPLFCILSDGYRFIFMQLKGRELLLEHTSLEPYGHMKSGAAITAKVIKVRELDVENFKMLISPMTQLITSSLSSTGETVGMKNNKDNSDG